MSGIKIDIQWSPVDDDIFITCGTAINLYQVQTEESQYGDGGIFNENSRPVHLATNAELQFMKCVAWCPRPEPKNILAVAQANGRISITSFGNEQDDLVGKEFNVRYNRQCNCLSWNPVETNLLAECLEKKGTEPSVLVWDVMSNASMELSDRSRHSFSEGPVTKPAVELGAGETSSSFSWFPSDPKTFVVGMANKHLRIFDLRDTNKPRRESHHRFVSGVCIDPQDGTRLASYTEAQVAIWDLRSFDRPINIITESKNVVKMSWCPTKTGVLSVLCKDSSFVKLHDIRHSLFGSDEIEQASIERNIHPFGKSHVSSYCWHPRHENRLMTVLPNGDLRHMTVHERIPMELSSSFKLMMPLCKELIRCVEDTSQEEDIAVVMKRRVMLNYGLYHQDIMNNMKIVEGEPHLQGLWQWIFNIRTINATQAANNSKQLVPHSAGILSILRFDKEDDYLKSEPVFVQWKASDGSNYMKKTHYRSNERLLALQMCGWVPDIGTAAFEPFINRLVEEGEHERAAAIALFYLHIKKALEILSVKDKPNLQAVAMALSGYTEDKSALWRRTCGTLGFDLDSPHLRAIFGFLSCEDDNYENVLNEVGMSVEDRVAFALNYLSDSKLKTYLCKLSEELTRSGELDGILLTGMSGTGINLLENFVDRSSDIQTAAIAAVYSSSPAVMKDLRVLEWIDGYRELLDQWRLWHQRAQFDILRQSFSQEPKMVGQVMVSCNFCGKSISPNTSLVNRARNILHSAFSRGPQNRPKITCCPSCRKALPRCAICLTNMGTSSGTGIESGSGAKLTPFQEWFTWCQTCRHGGHAAHLTQWFSTHSECPVTGCTCKCAAQDAVSQRLPRATAGGTDELVTTH